MARWMSKAGDEVLLMDQPMLMAEHRLSSSPVAEAAVQSKLITPSPTLSISRHVMSL